MNNTSPALDLYSRRLQKIDSENAFKLGPHIARLESEGRSVVRLNLGEPDFNVPGYILEEVKRQLDLGNTHYCDPQGVLPFREAIVEHLARTRDITVSPECVVVFPGAKPAIGFTQQVYLNPGDEVIYPSPGFPIYESLIRLMDGVPVPLYLKEEREFSFGAEDLTPLITPRTKLIFLNFPSNPTGGVASKSQLEEIAQVILKRSIGTCRVFSDEIYEDIVFDGRTHHSIASIPGMQERTIICSGLSKSFSWTGGRLGYAVFPSQEEAQIFRNLNINYFSCVPPFLQMAGRVALSAPEREEWLHHVRSAFQLRRDYMVPALNAIQGFKCLKPHGAFYVFPNIARLCEEIGATEAFNRLSERMQKKTSPATLFQMFALYHHCVAVMDRASFGKIGSQSQSFLRLSTAASADTLKKGIERLQNAASDKSGFRKFIQREQNFGA